MAFGMMAVAGPPPDPNFEEDEGFDGGFLTDERRERAEVRDSNNALNKSLKVAVLGSRGCGKSTLIYRLMFDKIGYISPTKKDVVYHMTESGEGMFYPEGARREFRHLPLTVKIAEVVHPPTNSEHIEDADAFLLCYSVTDRSSKSHIAGYIDLIKAKRGTENLNINMVACKCDSSDRVVTRIEGDEEADRLGLGKNVETEARQSNKGIHSIQLWIWSRDRALNGVTTDVHVYYNSRDDCNIL